jgi:hypothetical protein
MDASARPMLISHTNIEDDTGYARFVSREHARLVAGGGGVLGAWPISTRPAAFTTFIDHIKRMVDGVCSKQPSAESGSSAARPSVQANTNARAGLSTSSRRSPASSTPLRRRRGTTFTSR